VSEASLGHPAETFHRTLAPDRSRAYFRPMRNVDIGRTVVRLLSRLSRLFLRVVTGGSFLIYNDAGARRPPAGLEEYVYPQDDLGAVYTPQATTFKLWAPTADAVSIILFPDATSASSFSLPMSCETGGVWSARIDGDQEGKYYLYEITFGSRAKKPTLYHVNDPYARGCSANTGRTLIYDPGRRIRKVGPRIISFR
jgi:hypothetical protein